MFQTENCELSVHYYHGDGFCSSILFAAKLFLIYLKKKKRFVKTALRNNHYFGRSFNDLKQGSINWSVLVIAAYLGLQ